MRQKHRTKKTEAEHHAIIAQAELHPGDKKLAEEARASKAALYAKKHYADKHGESQKPPIGTGLTFTGKENLKRIAAGETETDASIIKRRDLVGSRAIPCQFCPDHEPVILSKYLVHCVAKHKMDTAQVLEKAEPQLKQQIEEWRTIAKDAARVKASQRSKQTRLAMKKADRHDSVTVDPIEQNPMESMAQGINLLKNAAALASCAVMLADVGPDQMQMFLQMMVNRQRLQKQD